MSPVARRQRPVPATMQSVHMPAPVGGLNTMAPALAMPAGDCMACYNLVAAEYGLRTRLGQREWVTGLTGASDNQVRSLLPFTGSTKNGSNDKLFAVTSSGIWDVSSSTTTPTQLVTFGTQTGDAGYGTSTVFVTTAGHFLVYCDEVNGYYLYTQNSNSWAAGSVTPAAGSLSAADLRAPLVFKNRLWFVEKDTDKAWYFDLNAITGNITSFPMGKNFRRGGPLVGLWSWTYDGGAGLDDSLVAVSNGGDVLVWQLTDPNSPSGTLLKGVWYAGGAPPEGRRIATTYGGDLLLLTRVGILPMSRLVVGGSSDSGQYTTAKIANLFARIMLTRAAKKGWQMRLHPEENTLMVVTPVNDGSATEQLVMSLPTRSWSQYRDLPVYGAAEVWGGKLYFGTADGKVKINDGTVDGVTLADPNSYAEIEWSAISAYNNLGNGQQKQVQILRPILLSEGSTPRVAVEARYGLSLTEVSTVPAATPSSGAWDSGLWDTAVWGGDYSPTLEVRGAVGMGPQVAVAIKGKATSRTVWVGTDIGFTQGGFL